MCVVADDALRAHAHLRASRLRTVPLESTPLCHDGGMHSRRLGASAAKSGSIAVDRSMPLDTGSAGRTTPPGNGTTRALNNHNNPS